MQTIMELHAKLSHYLSFSLLIISCCYIQSVFSAAASGTVGINYGRVADDLPTPQQVVQLLKTQGITKAKIFDVDAAVLSAFSGSGISITVCLPNKQIPEAAANTAFTDTWVKTHIAPHLPSTKIDAIAVGNEVFDVKGNNPTQFLVAAMKNMHASLVKHNLASTVKVSTPVAYGALQTSYPPSTGSFKQDLIEPVIKPMLAFLKETGSYFMINIYPFFAYSTNTNTIKLDHALFRNSSDGSKDPNNGLHYKSLLEAQLDAVYAAMATLGYKDLKAVVTETGWPSKGDENQVGASLQNAAAYNGNLVRRVLTGGGTPLRPNQPLEVYIFALFNENKKDGPTSERNYGLFYPNQKTVYDIPLTAEGLNGKAPLRKLAAVEEEQTS